MVGACFINSLIWPSREGARRIFPASVKLVQSWAGGQPSPALEKGCEAMKPRCAWMFLTVSALAISTGCVSQKQLDDLMAVNRQLESQKLDLQAQIEATNSLVSALRADTSTADQIAALGTQRDQLLRRLPGLHPVREFSRRRRAITPRVLE